MTTKDMDTKAEALAQQAWADLEQHIGAIEYLARYGPDIVEGSACIDDDDLKLVEKLCRVVLGEMALRRSRGGPPPKGLED
jgi:hypothetical protein